MAQLMPLPLTVSSVKSRLVLPFWYQLTQIVLDKGPLNVCVCVCVCVFREKPHVVFLQEVVADTLEIIRQKCAQYRCIVGRYAGDHEEMLDGEYFVAMLLRNDAVKYTSHEVTRFHSSQMGRVLLTVQVFGPVLQTCSLLHYNTQCCANLVSNLIRQISNLQA